MNQPQQVVTTGGDQAGWEEDGGASSERSGISSGMWAHTPLGLPMPSVPTCSWEREGAIPPTLATTPFPHRQDNVWGTSWVFFRVAI